MSKSPAISHAIILDYEREQRIGFDEAVLCAQKTPEQIAAIIHMNAEAGKNRLFTRLDPEKFSRLAPELQEQLDYNAEARTAIAGSPLQTHTPPNIAIVSAGSSDAPIVAEAAETLRYYGQPCTVISDVGVAGIWRLLERIDEIAQYPIVIAVAGMDAALPTVLGGLVPSAIIGVPTSTGYGAADQGKTALSAMLVSCTQGLTVVNIDNGFGAACAALRMMRIAGKL